MFDEFVDREKVVDEYDAREDVAAVYAMGTATLGRLTAVAGARYEHTTVSSVAWGHSGVFEIDTTVERNGLLSSPEATARFPGSPRIACWRAAGGPGDEPVRHPSPCTSAPLPFP